MKKGLCCFVAFALLFFAAGAWGGSLEMENRNMLYPDKKVQERALYYLEFYQDPCSARPLLAAVEKGDFLISQKAAKLLGRLDTDSASQLAKLLDSDDPDLRIRGTLALGFSQDERAEHEVRKMLDDPDYKVFFAALASLQEMGKINKELEQALRDDCFDFSDDLELMVDVKAGLATKAPGRFFSSAQVLELKKQIRARLEAVRKGSELQNALALLSHENEYVRSRAIEKLVALKSQEACPALIELFSDPHYEVYGGAIHAAGELKCAEAAPRLFEILKAKGESKKGNAAMALGRLAPPGALEALLPLLEDKSYSIRQSGVKALVELGNPGAVAPLCKMLQDPDANLKSEAIRALGRTGAKEAVEPLAKELDGQHGKAAFRALGALGQAEAGPYLLKALKDGCGFESRSAYPSLAKYKDPKAFDAALALMDRDPFIACDYLGKLGDKRAIPILRKRLGSDYRMERGICARALENLGYQPEGVREQVEFLVASERWDKLGDKGEAALPALIGLFDTQKDILFRGYDWQSPEGPGGAFAKIGPPAVVALVGLLKNPGAPLGEKAKAISVLGFMKAEEAADVLPGMLDTPNKYFRSLVAKSLYQMGWSPKTPHEKACWAVARENWKVAAAMGRESLPLLLEDMEKTGTPPPALGMMGGVAFEALLARLENDKGRNRLDLIMLLGDTGDPRAAGPLLAYAESRDGEERKAAVIALGKLRDKRAIPALAKALKDEDESVRGEAVAALGMMGDENVLPTLIPLIHDQGYYYTRPRVAAALGAIGGKETVNPLVFLLGDEMPDVHESARAALGLRMDPHYDGRRQERMVWVERVIGMDEAEFKARMEKGGGPVEIVDRNPVHPMTIAERNAKKAWLASCNWRQENPISTPTLRDLVRCGLRMEQDIYVEPFEMKDGTYLLSCYHNDSSYSIVVSPDGTYRTGTRPRARR